jgi:hypothetical protein
VPGGTSQIVNRQKHRTFRQLMDATPQGVHGAPPVGGVASSAASLAERSDQLSLALEDAVVSGGVVARAAEIAFTSGTHIIISARIGEVSLTVNVDGRKGGGPQGAPPSPARRCEDAPREVPAPRAAAAATRPPPTGDLSPTSLKNWRKKHKANGDLRRSAAKRSHRRLAGRSAAPSRTAKAARAGSASAVPPVASSARAAGGTGARHEPLHPLGFPPMEVDTAGPGEGGDATLQRPSPPRAPAARGGGGSAGEVVASPRVAAGDASSTRTSAMVAECFQGPLTGVPAAARGGGRGGFGEGLKKGFLKR